MPEEPTHLEITATGDGYRAVIVAEIGVFSASLQRSLITAEPHVQAHTVRAYFGLRCAAVESVRAVSPGSPQQPK